MTISLGARIGAAILSAGMTFAFVALIAAYAYPDEPQTLAAAG